MNWYKKASNNGLTQQEAMELFLPLIKSEGKRYAKFKNVLARPAKKGEKIETVTSDGKETENVANEGDIVVQNLTGAKEQYIIKSETFQKRYESLGEKEGEWELYKPTGEAFAIIFNPEELGVEEPFYFEASWGETMPAKKGDFIATTLDFNEVYRIARQEFMETYKEAK